MRPADMLSRVKERSSRQVAELALLVGTLFWGCSFTWAKDGAEAVNRAAGLAPTAVLGPLLLLGTRFVIGGALWLALFPAARRGWTWRSIARAGLLGALLALAMGAQVIGLLTTSEAVSAFLTSLTVLFVPLISTIGLRRPPAPLEWIGVALATVGIYLMTAAGRIGAGFALSAGVWFGLAASVLFSLYILAVNQIIPKEGSPRMTAGQFLVCGVLTLIGIALAWPVMGWGAMEVRSFASWPVLSPLVLLVLLPTLCAYGLLNRFQPYLDPTRAAILYLAEPLFAAGYAWVVAGRPMSAVEIAGAGLILAANVVVEVLKSGSGEKA